MSQKVSNSLIVGDLIQVQNVRGDVTITLAKPVYRLEPFPAARPALSPEDARRQPSRLLHPGYEAVPFMARTDFLGKLAGWLGEPSPASVCLLHGPGGSGKSRLAARVVLDCQRSGWTAWVARPSSRNPVNLTISDAAGGLLVVVDYAERWPVSDLLSLIEDLRYASGHALATATVRILLVARSSGFWWMALEARLDSELHIPSRAWKLPSLIQEVDRREIYTVARDRFARALGLEEAALAAPASRAQGTSFDQVLAVHMAALADVDACQQGTVAPSEPHGISAYLLKRERAYWQALHTRHGDPLPTPPQTMARAVFTATLSGPLQRRQAASAVSRVRIADAIDVVNRILDDHRECYPPEDPATALEPLHPDRLGEDFVALATPGQVVDPAVIDDWAQSALADLLGTREETEAAPPWMRHAVTVLVEASSRWPHLARQQVYPLLREHPELAVAAGSGAISALTEHPHIDFSVLEAIENVLPPHQHAELDVASAAISQTLIRYRLSSAHDDDARARIYQLHSFRLGNVGLRGEALESARKALAIFRKLAVRDRARWTFSLIQCLSNISHDYAALGFHRKALDANEEAIELFQRENYPGTASYLRLQATLLDNQGIHRTRLGRRDEAFASFEQAIRIRRLLTANDPAYEELVLARSIGNLGKLMSQDGQHRRALPLLAEATVIVRNEAQRHPKVYDDELAGLLDGLAMARYSLGQHAAAAVAAEEAVEISRQLAQLNPRAHQEGLIKHLQTFSICLGLLRRFEEALAASGEALEINRQLVHADPVDKDSGLARLLNNHSLWLSGLNRHDEAIAASDQSVEINRRLAGTGASGQLELARSLDSSALVRNAACEDLEMALRAADEAIAIGRAAYAEAPPAFKADYLTFFDTAASTLLALGRPDQASNMLLLRQEASQSAHSRGQS